MYFRQLYLYFPQLHSFQLCIPTVAAYRLTVPTPYLANGYSEKTDHYNGSKHPQRGGGLRAKSKVRLGAGL